MTHSGHQAPLDKTVLVRVAVPCGAPPWDPKFSCIIYTHWEASNTSADASAQPQMACPSRKCLPLPWILRCLPGNVSRGFGSGEQASNAHTVKHHLPHVELCETGVPVHCPALRLCPALSRATTLCLGPLRLKLCVVDFVITIAQSSSCWDELGPNNPRRNQRR